MHKLIKRMNDPNTMTVTKTKYKDKVVTYTRSEADSGRGGATVIDSFTPKFHDIGEPGL